MKVIAIILSGLLLQTSASFFDDIRGAVSSVESSFGKLLNDVIDDVKETIDCTLLAVEQVMALGVYGDASDYDRRCRDATEVVEEPVAVVERDPAPPPVQEVAIPLTKTEHRQIDSSILDVDQVLCDVLKKDDAHAQLENVKLALKNETERLNEISELLKKQLEELSAEVKDKFKSIELQTSEPSVESIWNDIKLLQEIEQKHKNTDEARKISRILDQILNMLDANEEDRSAADEYKIREIMRKLSKQSKGGESDVWKDSKDYPKDFRDYARRLFDKSRVPTSDASNKPKEEGGNEKKDEGDKSNNSTEKDDSDKIEKPKEVTTVKPKRKRKPKITTTTTEKQLTVEDLAAEYGSLFDVMPDIERVHSKKASESAKSILEDAELNEAVMNSLAEMGSSNEAQNLLDESKLLDDFKK